MVTIFFAIGLVVLGILVLVHELGHFVAAKRCGIRVLAFSIGFGKPLIKKTFGGTEYRICAVPFGGYVAMSGEHPEEKSTVEQGDFTAQPKWQRAIVAVSGPAANFIFAMACLYIVFVAGVDEPLYLKRPIIGAVSDSSSAMQAGFLAGDSVIAINGKPVRTWEDIELQLTSQQRNYRITFVRDNTVLTKTLALSPWNGKGLPPEPTGGLFPVYSPIVGSVGAGTPAAAAGFRAGDTVVGISGKKIYSWEQLTQFVIRFDSLAGPLRFMVKRGDNITSLMAVPAFNKSAGRFQIGITRGNSASVVVRYGPLAAFGKMLDATWENTTMVFNIIGKLTTKQVSAKELSGPIGIVQWIGIVALSGPVDILKFMAMIGINLAILNLLPLVITDGGLLLFLLLEALRGKPLSVRAQSMVNRVAIAFFIMLFMYVTYNDLGRLPDLLRIMTGR